MIKILLKIQFIIYYPDEKVGGKNEETSLSYLLMVGISKVFNLNLLSTSLQYKQSLYQTHLKHKNRC